VIDNSRQETEDIGVGMYSYLICSFNFLAPIHHIYAISSRSSSSMRFVPFRNSYFNKPWTLPSLTMSCEGQSHIGMEIPLSAVEVAYQVVINTSANLDPFSSWKDEEDPILETVWATQSSCSHDFLDDNLPSDEAILAAMNGHDRPWDNMNHRSYFLPELVRIEQDEFRYTLSAMVGHVVVLLDTHGIYVEGNMVNISPTIMINISQVPGKIESVYIGAGSLPK
jgi:hypothetical protein